MKYARLTRAIDAGAELPAEFVLFKAGSNDSTKGPAVWDAKAAELVMARAAERAGVRYPIDLEHRSLDDTARSLTKDATDAMGYFDLAVRGGDLWAVNVQWNEEGAERLRSKRQVYFSPAFYTDEDERVIEVINVALTSMPATHGLAPLVAASRQARSTSANELQQALCAALFDKYPRNDADPSASAYICDVYPESLVYDYEGKTWQIAYAYANGTAQFTGEPVQVMRQYVPVSSRTRRVAIAYLEARLHACNPRAKLCSAP